MRGPDVKRFRGLKPEQLRADREIRNAVRIISEDNWMNNAENAAGRRRHYKSLLNNLQTPEQATRLVEVANSRRAV